MSREELEVLAEEKQTTPEVLARLISEQAFFEQIFNLDFLPSEPGQREVEPILQDKLYSETELVRWFEWAAANEHNPLWQQKILAGRIVFGAGLRVSELLKLSVPENCHPNGIISVIKSKRGRSRSVKISPELAPYWPNLLNKPGQVFSATTTRTLERWWDDTMEAAGIPKNGRSIHSGRHTYASTELASRRLNAVEVQTQLGHRSITMTLGMYVHATTESMYNENKIPAWWDIARGQQGLRVVTKIA
jgi:integrase